MQPLAVDFPLSGDDLLIYANTAPFGGSFGDSLWEACTVPPGWTAEVVTPPVLGSVVLSCPNGWTYESKPGVNQPGNNTPDPFTYRLTDGNGNYSNTATVTPTVYVEF